MGAVSARVCFNGGYVARFYNVEPSRKEGASITARTVDDVPHSVHKMEEVEKYNNTDLRRRALAEGQVLASFLVPALALVAFFVFGIEKGQSYYS